MAMKKLFLGVASYSGAPDFECSAAAQRDLMMLGGTGQWQIEYELFGGNLDVPRIRNQIFERAYNQGADELLFLDDDISWAEHGLIGRLLNRENVEVVGYPYMKRSDTDAIPWTIIPTKREERPKLPMPGDLMEVIAAPTGFLRITRSAMDKMVKAYDDRWYHEPESPRGRVWSLFEFGIWNRRRVTDDTHFCYLWKDIGGKIWVDPDATISHHGRKRYTGCLRTWIKEEEQGKHKDRSKWM